MGAAMGDHKIDDNTIRSCQDGDRDAFRVLFEAYKDRVYSIAFHFCSDETAARDITQQVFLKLFTSINQFRYDAEFTTWLYRMVANMCIDEQRKQRRFLFFGQKPEIKEPGKKYIEEHYIRRELADSVKAAIAELKPKLRIAILLKYFEDLSYDEIASVLGVSKGTVASRLNRGHAALAQKLAHLRDTVAAGE
ncbi:MAG TPA: sigma-70 family RNA polymerase sigma factor [Blastocatellia bacterium]|nr:sigma-70 family RNA polymerase sigma factor [Blastocatellia bacterium]